MYSYGKGKEEYGYGRFLGLKGKKIGHYRPTYSKKQMEYSKKQPMIHHGKSSLNVHLDKGKEGYGYGRFLVKKGKKGEYYRPIYSKKQPVIHSKKQPMTLHGKGEHIHPYGKGKGLPVPSYGKGKNDYGYNRVLFKKGKKNGYYRPTYSKKQPIATKKQPMVHHGKGALDVPMGKGKEGYGYGRFLFKKGKKGGYYRPTYSKKQPAVYSKKQPTMLHEKNVPVHSYGKGKSLPYHSYDKGQSEYGYGRVLFKKGKKVGYYRPTYSKKQPIINFPKQPMMSYGKGTITHSYGKGGDTYEYGRFLGTKGKKSGYYMQTYHKKEQVMHSKKQPTIPYGKGVRINPYGKGEETYGYGRSLGKKGKKNGFYRPTYSKKQPVVSKMQSFIPYGKGSTFSSYEKGKEGFGPYY